MRGGAASCTVVVSDEDVGSPIVRRPRSLMVLNRPSLDKFLPALTDGGLLVVNASLTAPGAPDESAPGAGRTVQIRANDIAEGLGNQRMANMVMLGAWIEATGACALPAVESCLDQIFPARNAHLIPANAKALRAGAQAAKT
jgi:2-oxoglutarate ferredoxin oxidoreductase subunit gamma